jgi:hypothetical protein
MLAGRRIGNALLVRRAFQEAGQDYLKAFVERVTAAPGRICIAADRGASAFQWIVAHSLGSALELSGTVSPHMSDAGARGGGRGSRMQGVASRVEGMERFAQDVEADLVRSLGKEKA